MVTKTIILVRHGQYHKADDKNVERLTNLGRKQALFVAKRLRELKINKITYSTMPRAIETAEVIKKHLRFKKRFLECDFLRECIPGYPSNLRKKPGFTHLKNLEQDIRQAEKAFKKHFKKPTRTSVEVLVCHGNIIRYLVCRLLGVNPIVWSRLDIQQCGISVVELRSSGNNPNVLLSHNDVGHIPLKLRTFI